MERDSMKTVIETPRVFVAHVEDGQGRRLVIGERKNEYVMESALTVALNQIEARALVDALRDLLGDLPGNGAP
jgi:hypothetical protein